MFDVPTGSYLIQNLYTVALHCLWFYLLSFSLKAIIRATARHPISRVLIENTICIIERVLVANYRLSKNSRQSCAKSAILCDGIGCGLLEPCSEGVGWGQKKSYFSQPLTRMPDKVPCQQNRGNGIAANYILPWAVAMAIELNIPCYILFTA